MLMTVEQLKQSLNVKYESSFEVLSLQLFANSGGTTENCGLFNGVIPNEYNTENVFYWYESGDHITIRVDNPFRIWRWGVDSWSGYRDPLNLYKLEDDGTTWTDVSSQYNLPLNSIGNSDDPEVFTETIPLGTYKFEITTHNNRIDTEWYIENMMTMVCLFKNKKNGLYYVYNGDTDSLELIEDQLNNYTKHDNFKGIEFTPNILKNIKDYEIYIEIINKLYTQYTPKANYFKTKTISTLDFNNIDKLTVNLNLQNINETQNTNYAFTNLSIDYNIGYDYTAEEITMSNGDTIYKYTIDNSKFIQIGV